MFFLVFGSPVRSGLLPIFGRTETETGPHLFQTGKRPDWTAEDRSFAVFCGLLPVLRPVFGPFGLNRFKTGFFDYSEITNLLPYFVALI